MPLRGQALPFLEETLLIFGPERCMIGSDWPVSLASRSDYSEWMDLVLSTALRGAGDEDRSAVAWRTAARFYGIDQDPSNDKD